VIYGVQQLSSDLRHMFQRTCVWLPLTAWCQHVLLKSFLKSAKAVTKPHFRKSFVLLHLFPQKVRGMS